MLSCMGTGVVVRPCRTARTRNWKYIFLLVHASTAGIVIFQIVFVLSSYFCTYMVQGSFVEGDEDGDVHSAPCMRHVAFALPFVHADVWTNRRT